MLKGVLAPALLMLLVLCGCAGPTFVVQQYAGPALPQSTIATLRVNGSEAVRLVTLDGEDIAAPLESDSRLHIELLPGRHSLSVRNANTPSEPTEPIVFVAEVGKVYRVVFLAGVGTPGPRIHEVNRGTDALGLDVTGAEPRPQ